MRHFAMLKTLLASLLVFLALVGCPGASGPPAAPAAPSRQTCTGKYAGTGGAYMEFLDGTKCTMVNGDFSAPCTCTPRASDVMLDCGGGNETTGVFVADCAAFDSGGFRYERIN